MSNPALNEKAFQQSIATDPTRSGWAAPAPDTISPWTPAGPAGPVGPMVPDSMRVSGVASATGVLLAILMVAAYFGWQAVKVTTGIDRVSGKTVVTDMSIPPWLFLSWIVGFGIAIVTVFKPKIARITGPLYALAEGLLVGGISHIFNAQFEGIVVQAVGLTVGVFVMMLGLFAFRIIKVTEKLRMAIIASTGAIMLVYLVSFVMSMFGANVGFIHSSGPMGIGFSLLVVGIASMNLLLDFDLVERGVAAGAPRYMEWYSAFGLLVTLVWLYLEILRLLSKLRQN